MAAAPSVTRPSPLAFHNIPKRPMVPPVLVKIPIAPRLCLQLSTLFLRSHIGLSSPLERAAPARNTIAVSRRFRCRARTAYLTVTHLSRAFWTALTRRPTPADSMVTRMAVWTVSWGWKVCASLAEGM